MKRAGLRSRLLAGLGMMIAVLGAVGAAGAAGAETWQEPPHWSAPGDVAAWRELDAKFYRVHEDSRIQDEAVAQLDQQAEYQKTFAYRGRLDGIDLAAWQALSPADRDERTTAAAAELEYLVDFRRRLLDQAQRTRMGQPSGWGLQVSDPTVIGTALGKLRTAVGLDPANPYAWHLYAYLCALVGDDQRAQGALAGAEAALAAVPSGALRDLRAAIALERAWLLRSRGDFAAARESLVAAAGYGAGGLEPKLLQGLLAAQMGDDRTAVVIAGELRRTEVAAFPVNMRSAGFAPEVANVEVWARHTSSYLADWIVAHTWLRVGRPDLAATALGPQRLNDQRPFAHRFWNEAGSIYELTGRRSLALAAWNQARITTPYHPYFVAKSYSVGLGRLTGRPGAVSYTLSYDGHFLTGNRLAYGAALVQELAAEPASDQDSELRRQELAARALDQLEICQREGLFRGQALILEGEVYHLMQDATAALAAVQAGLAHLDQTGDQAGLAAVLSGLNRSRGELSPQDLAHFYGQSGSSQGRWQDTDDPEAALTALRQDYMVAGTDAARRALARFLIRNGSESEGRALAALGLAGAAPSAESVRGLAAADLELMLEADRSGGDSAVALLLVEVLQSGAPDPWPSAPVWTLAGFICLDQDLRSEARTALKRAAELDPGNQGLKVQLSFM